MVSPACGCGCQQLSASTGRRPLEIHRRCKRSGRCKPGLLTSHERESPEAWRPRVPSGRGRGQLLRTRTLGSASPSSVAPARDSSSGVAVSRHLRGGGSAQVRLRTVWRSRPGGPAGRLSAGRAGRRTGAASLPPSQLRADLRGATGGAGGLAGRPGVPSSGPRRGRTRGGRGLRGAVCVRGMQSHRGPGRGTAQGTEPQPRARRPRASPSLDD